MIGIGGASMQNLALLSQKLGLEVSGSDRSYSDVLERLKSHGIRVVVGSDCEEVERADLVVYSSAVGQDDTERTYALNVGKMEIERKEYLGALSKLFDRVVSIGGSHGKSTMSAMVAWVLARVGADITTHLGCKPIGCEGFVYADKRDIFVCEACEYRRSFLELDSYIGVITAVDYDHPDTYPTRQDLLRAFEEFGQKSQILIMSEQAKSQLKLPCVSYGMSEDCDYFARKIRQNRGKYRCQVVHDGQSVNLNLNVYGKHNLLNALGAVAVCNTLGYDLAEIVKFLEGFCGIERRFECKGKMKSGARIVVDYAHHPTEIEAAINTASQMTKGKIWTIFQPHTYSRTAKLMDEFVDSFYWSDEIILLPTFSAREEEKDGKNSWELYQKLLDSGQICIYAQDMQSVADGVRNMTGSDDIVLVLGAGDVNKMAEMLMDD